MLRLLVILFLGLYLSHDQCNGSGFEELCRKQYCRADAAKNSNCPTKNGPSMSPSQSTTFSRSDCSPGTMYEPYVCKNCYKGTEENGAFSCQRCKLGRIKSKPVIVVTLFCSDLGSKAAISPCIRSVYYSAFIVISRPVLALFSGVRRRPQTRAEHLVSKNFYICNNSFNLFIFSFETSEIKWMFSVKSIKSLGERFLQSSVMLVNLILLLQNLIQVFIT